MSSRFHEQRKGLQRLRTTAELRAALKTARKRLEQASLHDAPEIDRAKLQAIIETLEWALGFREEQA